MIYIILIHGMNFYVDKNQQIKNVDGNIFFRKETSENSVYISSSSNPEECIRIHSPRPLLDDYELAELDDIVVDPDSLMCSNLEYRNLDFLYQALQVIANNFICYVDNDFGTLLSVSDFIKKWNSTPDWNWSHDFDSIDD